MTNSIHDVPNRQCASENKAEEKIEGVDPGDIQIHGQNDGHDEVDEIQPHRKAEDRIYLELHNFLNCMSATLCAPSCSAAERSYLGIAQGIDTAKLAGGKTVEAGRRVSMVLCYGDAGGNPF